MTQTKGLMRLAAIVMCAVAFVAGAAALPHVAGAFVGTTSASASWRAGTLAPPGAITVSVTCATGDDVVDLAWAPSSSANADGYEVERLRNGVADGTVRVTASNVSQTLDLGTPAEWTWNVRTTDGSWRSAASSLTDGSLACP